MHCSKCGKELAEDSVFCRFCGNKIVQDINGNEDLAKSGSGKVFKKGIILGIVGVITLVVFIIFYSLNSSPVNAIFEAINDKDFEKMQSIYNDEIKGVHEREQEVIERLSSEITDVVNDFYDNKITDEDAVGTLNDLARLGLLKAEIKDSQKEISEVNNSRVSFADAERFASEKKYRDALVAYDKVIEKDTENYEKAMERIGEISQKYKQEIINEANTLMEEESYRRAVSLVNLALQRLPNDADLNEVMSVANNLLAEKEKAEIEKTRNEQLVTVESTRILVQTTDSRLKWVYPDLFEVVVKNQSGQTVQSYKVSMLGWDANGYPIIIRGGFFATTGNFEYQGRADYANVVSGNTYGRNSGWELGENHNIRTTKAVVIEAVFYDGTTWTNPYYNHFQNKYMGKPLED